MKIQSEEVICSGPKCVKNTANDLPRILELQVGEWTYEISIIPYAHVKLKKSVNILNSGSGVNSISMAKGKSVVEMTDGSGPSSQQKPIPIPSCNQHVVGPVATLISKRGCKTG